MGVKFSWLHRGFSPQTKARDITQSKLCLQAATSMRRYLFGRKDLLFVEWTSIKFTAPSSRVGERENFYKQKTNPYLDANKRLIVNGWGNSHFRGAKQVFWPYPMMKKINNNNNNNNNNALTLICWVNERF